MLATNLGARRWVPNYYPAAEIPYIPKNIKLSGNEQYLLDYMKHSDVDELFELVSSAAKHSMNVAADEYINREHLLERLDDSHVFIARSTTTEDVKAGIIVQPWLHRSHAPRIARIHVIMDGELSDAYMTLTRLAERIVADLDLGYEACFMMVCISCVSIYKQLREHGYTTAMAVPYAYLTQKHEYLTSYVMYKYLQPSTKVIPMSSIIALADSSCTFPAPEKERGYPKHPSVLVQYTFKNGKTVLLRNMERNEAEYVFELFTYSAKAGIGYSYEEVPTFQYYKEYILPYTCTVILEAMDTGKPLAVLQVGPSWYNLGQSTPLGDLDIILDPGFKGNGMGFELQAIGMTLIKDKGYKGLLSDIFEDNKPVVKTSIQNKFAFIGVLPKTAYLCGKGWTDSLFCYRDCDDIPSLDQLIERSRAKRLSKL